MMFVDRCCLYRRSVCVVLTMLCLSARVGNMIAHSAVCAFVYLASLSLSATATAMAIIYATVV